MFNLRAAQAKADHKVEEALEAGAEYLDKLGLLILFDLVEEPEQGRVDWLFGHARSLSDVEVFDDHLAHSNWDVFWPPCSDLSVEVVGHYGLGRHPVTVL